MSLLSVREVHTYYGDSYILKGVSLEVAPGSVVAVLGRNGAGKTTLIRSIMGLTPARRGRILYRDADITHYPTHRIARSGIGLVPQGRRIFPSLTTRENMGVAARGGGRLGWSIEKVTERFPNLAARLQTKGKRLSGGEQQMLAFGRALVGDADLLLLDEPTEGLAPLFVAEIAKFVSEIREHGISILIVEQSLPFAVRIADRAYVMERGVIVHESTPAELQKNGEVKARYLGI